MTNDFPHLKTRYERFLFLPHKNYTPSPFPAVFMDLSNPSGGRRFNIGGNITVNYIQTSTQEALEIPKANSILAEKKKSQELPFF